ncbi:hypothetical protein [Polaromonas sp. JS666]|uniref:hypothetical protein n=1 Tax=Polaromonas sp. (strain JS666 / ATCC BAA-500) TaxID=296591 RepID=UPI0000464245|nr:hypothetical protein [Polaromonas sp. JS666]ABE44070.1 hypothetical protein Bpro_2143 [Polaromonas sp. JS666]
MSAATTIPTDALLVKATLSPGNNDHLPDCLPAIMQHLRGALKPSPAELHSAFSAAHKMLYIYLHLPERVPLDKAVATTLELALEREWPQLQQVCVSRLQKVFEARGASAGSKPVFHYVVEMDPESGWMPELAQWYDTEHMPGLAAVPGCIRAARFLNHDHGPLSLACYDLVTEETLGSAPWLAVRATDWSSRMRPHFTHTVRSMFKVLPGSHTTKSGT